MILQTMAAAWPAKRKLFSKEQLNYFFPLQMTAEQREQTCESSPVFCAAMQFCVANSALLIIYRASEKVQLGGLCFAWSRVAENGMRLNTIKKIACHVCLSKHHTISHQQQHPRSTINHQWSSQKYSWILKYMCYFLWSGPVHLS